MSNPNTISQEEWEELEQYLSGEMTSGDSDKFNARLAIDPLKKEKLEEVRSIMLGIKEAALQNKLETFHQQLIQQAQSIPKKGKSTIFFWLAAASVMAVAVLALFFIVGKKEERLFTEYFEVDPGLATTMSASEDYAFNHAMIDYKSGNYARAIETWSKLLVTKRVNDTLHYFSGVAFLAMNRADSAAHHLRQVTDMKQSSFNSDACWYLALALLKEGNKKDAVFYIKQSSHPDKEEILTRIK